MAREPPGKGLNDSYASHATRFFSRRNEGRFAYAVGERGHILTEDEICMYIHGEKGKERGGGREREREKEQERVGEREGKRERDRERATERERKREREGESPRALRSVSQYGAHSIKFDPKL